MSCVLCTIYISYVCMYVYTYVLNVSVKLISLNITSSDLLLIYYLKLLKNLLLNTNFA